LKKSRKSSVFVAVPPPVRKASGFRKPVKIKERLRLGRRSRSSELLLDGKPEAFRTGGGEAAINKTKLHQA
jgi:hypothetical protein